MSTHEVATKLVEFCREGKNLEAINELYSDHVISREPKGSPGELIEGKEAVIAKHDQWNEGVETVHSAHISDPIVTGNFFACTMEMDVEFKQHGRMMIKEIALYEVRDGKIVGDQFFYNM